MNSKKIKRINKHANQLLFNWLASMLNEDEVKKLDIKKMDKYLPDQSHLFANNRIILSAYTPRWFKQKIKKFIKTNQKNIEEITTQDLENV